MLTPDQINAAWKLRARNVSWAKIGAEMGCVGRTVRDTLYPDRGQARNEHRKKLRKAKRKAAGPRARRVVPEALYTLPIPHEVLAYRESRAALAPQSLTAALLGDPLPGHREYLESLAQRRRT